MYCVDVFYVKVHNEVTKAGSLSGMYMVNNKMDPKREGSQAAYYTRLIHRAQLTFLEKNGQMVRESGHVVT